jgi:hypothetical protein
MKHSLAKYIFPILLCPILSFHGAYAQDEPPPTQPAKTYRILSGENYAINLKDDKEFLYFIPINYKIESEDGLGFAGPEDELQPNEQPETLRLKHVGMAIIGRINTPELLYVSFFIQGAIPSQCHKPKIEIKEERENDKIIMTNLIFAAVPRTQLCPTQNIPVEFTFLSRKLTKGVPTEIRINYQPFAEILWAEDDSLRVLQAGREWKITRISRIIAQAPMNRRWQSEWVNGKPMKAPPTAKPAPKPTPQNNEPKEPAQE